MTLLPGIALAAVLPTCASQSVALQRYRAALGRPWQHSYRLSGSDTDHRYVGYLSTREVRLYRWDGPFVQMWDDRPDAVTHTFWNGFVGVAGPWRKELRLAADEVLTGRVAARLPTAAACRRKHGRSYVALTFATTADVRVEVSLDRSTGLPSDALSSSEAGQISLSNLRYARVNGGVVPVSWDDGDTRYRFNRVAHGDVAVAHVMPARPSPIAGMARIPLVRNSANPASRGIRVRVDGKPATFLLDTGTSFTVISASLAARLHLRHVTRQYVSVAGGVGRATVAVARTLDIGPVHMRNEPVAILARTFGYEGAIGLSLFARADASFRGDVMTLSPYTARGSHEVSRHAWSPSVAPLDTFDGVPMVAGSIGGKGAQLVLDSGAALTGLFPDAYRDAGTKASAPSAECAIPGLVVEQYRYDTVRIGPASVALDACVTQFERIGPHLRFPLVGFLGMFGPIRSLRYESARMTADDGN